MMTKFITWIICHLFNRHDLRFAARYAHDINKLQCTKCGGYFWIDSAHKAQPWDDHVDQIAELTHGNHIHKIDVPDYIGQPFRVEGGKVQLMVYGRHRRTGKETAFRVVHTGCTLPVIVGKDKTHLFIDTMYY